MSIVSRIKAIGYKVIDMTFQQPPAPQPPEAATVIHSSPPPPQEVVPPVVPAVTPTPARREDS